MPEDVPARYARWARGRDPGAFPGRVTVELSDRCNLTCPMCPRSFHAGEGLMAWPLYEKVADEIAGHPGTAMVPFFRGESMMHPRFLDAMRLAKDRGIAPVQLVTNATLLTPEASRALIGLRIDFVSLSLDAVSPEAFERQRRGARHAEVMANVEAFLKLREEAGGPLPEVQVSAVETDVTRGEMAAFVARWRGRVDRVRLYEEHSTEGVFGALPDLPSLRRPCGKPLTDLVVYCDGRAALCNQDWERREDLGDVNRQTIAEVWRSPAYQRVRQLHLEGREAEEPSCRGCGHWAQYYREGGIVGRLIQGRPPWKR